MCQIIGRPPIAAMALGRYSVSSRNRVPNPPARMTTFIVFAAVSSQVANVIFRADAPGCRLAHAWLRLGDSA